MVVIHFTTIFVHLVLNGIMKRIQVPATLQVVKVHLIEYLSLLEKSRFITLVGYRSFVQVIVADLFVASNTINI